MTLTKRRTTFLFRMGLVLLPYPILGIHLVFSYNSLATVSSLLVLYLRQANFIAESFFFLALTTAQHHYDILTEMSVDNIMAIYG